MADPVPVAITGFTWGNGLIALLNVLVGGVLVALVRTRPALKKIAADREANLLQERADEMESMRERLAALEVERRIDRHRLNNVTQCLDALLMMIEMDPSKAAEAASRVKEMRATQMRAEAAEKGAVMAGAQKGADK